MPKKALYLAIFLHFSRKILRRVSPGKPSNSTGRYLVLLGLHRDRDDNPASIIVARADSAEAAWGIAADLNGSCGGNMYIVDSCGKTLIDMVSSFPEDRVADMNAFADVLPAMFFVSVFSTTAGNFLGGREKLFRKAAEKYRSKG
jgi:hypothetical protein